MIKLEAKLQPKKMFCRIGGQNLNLASITVLVSTESVPKTLPQEPHLRVTSLTLQ